jgi:arsenate reductase-like glutaredoxin family protein
MNQRIMELAREAQVAISRRELDELLQAEQDYTRAVISERDALKAELAELKKIRQETLYEAMRQGSELRKELGQ